MTGDTNHSKPLPLALNINQIDISASFSHRSKLAIHMDSISSDDISHAPIYFKAPYVSVLDQTILTCDVIKISLNYHPVLYTDFIYIHERLAKQSKNARISFITIDVSRINIIIPHTLNMSAAADDIALAVQVIKGMNFRNSTRYHKKLDECSPRILIILNDLFFELEDNPVDRSLTIHQQIWENEHVCRTN